MAFPTTLPLGGLRSVSSSGSGLDALPSASPTAANNTGTTGTIAGGKNVMEKAHDERMRSIAAAIAKSRATDKDGKDGTEGAGKEVRGSAGAIKDGVEAPHPMTIDVRDVLEQLLAAQLQYMADIKIRGAKVDPAALRAILQEAKLTPNDIVLRLETRLRTLCTHEYTEPMPQSNRIGGRGHSSVFVRDNIMREFDTLLTAMLTTLRGGKAPSLPPCAGWRVHGGAAAFAVEGDARPAVKEDEDAVGEEAAPFLGQPGQEAKVATAEDDDIVMQGAI